MPAAPSAAAASDPAAIDRVAVAEWIARHVDRVAALQTELQAALDAKRDALAAGLLDAITAITATEADLVRRLEELRQQRDLWLATQPAGPDVHSLGEAAARIDAGPELTEAIAAARQQAGAIQQQNWTHWVIAQRSAGHFEEMLGLIARRGQTPATYSAGPAAPPEHGGGLLDFAA